MNVMEEQERQLVSWADADLTLGLDCCEGLILFLPLLTSLHYLPLVLQDHTLSRDRGKSGLLGFHESVKPGNR